MWILNKLKADGPMCDASLMVEMMELLGEFSELKTVYPVHIALLAMWRVGELSRKEFKSHPSGEKVYIYSLNP